MSRLLLSIEKQAVWIIKREFYTQPAQMSDRTTKLVKWALNWKSDLMHLERIWPTLGPNLATNLAQIGSYSDQIWVHFGSLSQNLLKSYKPKCTEIWYEKVPDLSHLGPIETPDSQLFFFASYTHWWAIEYCRLTRSIEKNVTKCVIYWTVKCDSCHIVCKEWKMKYVTMKGEQ